MTTFPKTIIIFVSIFLLIVLFRPVPNVQAQESPSEGRLEARIENVLEEKEIEIMDKKQLYQKLEVYVTDGVLKGQRITIDHGLVPAANIPRYKENEEVVITMISDGNGNNTYYISDYVRRTPLLLLFAAFSLLTIIVGKLKGFTSLVAMGISFAVIILYILPQILNGANPVGVAVVGSLMIVPVTFYLSHGISKKTTIAIIGTATALIITGLLANYIIEVAKLTGFASEEAGFLQAAKQGIVNIKGLLLASIIIGLLGVLDDVTVSQAAVVRQLKEVDAKIGIGEMYKRAMNVGQDHIASMVNTLILVYAGAALPLLLLFVNSPHPFSEVINLEVVAEEIIRMLVGSIGLILAVPITTYLAAVWENGKFS